MILVVVVVVVVVVEIVGEECWRVAEVSLTLDGVPVQIVILWDVQRRGAQLSLAFASSVRSERTHARRREWHVDGTWRTSWSVHAMSSCG